MMYKFTSIDLSKDFNVQHQHVLRKICSLEYAYKESECFFKKSTYKSTQNKLLPLYYISNKGIKLLLAYRMFSNKKEAMKKYLPIVSDSAEFIVGTVTRPEDDYHKILCDFIGFENIDRQVPFLQYRVDYHIKGTNIFIEYDEDQHLSVSNKIIDEMRWLEIAANYYSNNHSHPTLIRVRKGGEIKSLAIISSLMPEHFKRKLNERFIHIC